MRLGKMRAARDLAEKSANVISHALAERLRIDGSLKGRKHSLLAQRQAAPTDEEQQQLELIRSSPLFDAAWYLRENHDVVRAGDEPGLHFLRHPTRPVPRAGPRLRHRPLRRRAPRGAGRTASTRWCTSCSREEGRGRTATRRRRERRPDGSRRAGAGAPSFEHALDGVRPALAARRPRGPSPGSPLVERALADGLPAPEQAGRQPRPTAAPKSALRGGGGARRAAPSTRTGTSRQQPVGDPTQLDPLVHFVDRRAGATCARPAWASTSGGTGAAYLDPTAVGRQPAAPLPALGRRAGARVPSRARRRPVSTPSTDRRTGAAAGLPVRGLRP